MVKKVAGKFSASRSDSYTFHQKNLFEKKLFFRDEKWFWKKIFSIFRFFENFDQISIRAFIFEKWTPLLKFDQNFRFWDFFSESIFSKSFFSMMKKYFLIGIFSKHISSFRRSVLKQFRHDSITPDAPLKKCAFFPHYSHIHYSHLVKCSDMDHLNHSRTQWGFVVPPGCSFSPCVHWSWSWSW